LEYLGTRDTQTQHWDTDVEKKAPMVGKIQPKGERRDGAISGGPGNMAARQKAWLWGGRNKLGIVSAEGMSKLRRMYMRGSRERRQSLCAPDQLLGWSPRH